MDAELRGILVDICRAAGVSGLKHEGRAELFIEGKSEVLFGDLGLDSLVLMELCIGIEEQLSVSFSPEQVARFGSLQQLANEISRGRN